MTSGLVSNLVGNRRMAGGCLRWGEWLRRQDGDPVLYILIFGNRWQWRTACGSGGYRWLADRREIPFGSWWIGCSGMGERTGTVIIENWIFRNVGRAAYGRGETPEEEEEFVRNIYFRSEGWIRGQSGKAKHRKWLPKLYKLFIINFILCQEDRFRAEFLQSRHTKKYR